MTHALLLLRIIGQFIDRLVVDAPGFFRQKGNSAVDQETERPWHFGMAIQREHKLRPGLFDHGPVIRVRRAAASFGAILRDASVGIVHAHDVEFLVLQDLQVEGRQRCMIVTHANHGDALRTPYRLRFAGLQAPGDHRGCDAAGGELPRTRQKIAAAGQALLGLKNDTR